MNGRVSFGGGRRGGNREGEATNGVLDVDSVGYYVDIRVYAACDVVDVTSGLVR